MSATIHNARQAPPALSFFERYLTLWVALTIVAGIVLGQVFPSFFQAVGALEVARVNLPVGLLIWVMIIPMLLRIDFGALGQVKSHVPIVHATRHVVRIDPGTRAGVRGGGTSLRARTVVHATGVTGRRLGIGGKEPGALSL